MKKLQQLKSIFLLGIIGVLMMHNAMPHVHHLHLYEKNKSTVEAHHHSHESGVTHSHHDHDGTENSDEESQDLFWSMFFGGHAHVIHNHTISEYTKDNYSLDIHQVVLSCTEPKCPDLSGIEIEKEQIALFNFRRDTGSILLNYTLRGPPSLG
jgi:hypothetical protein